MPTLDRRTVLKLVTGGAAAAALPLGGQAAPRLPASAICCRRMRREDTIAISAIAKKPFSRVSPTTMASSSQTVMTRIF